MKKCLFTIVMFISLVIGIGLGGSNIVYSAESEQPQLRVPWRGAAKITQGNNASRDIASHSHYDHGIWDNTYAIDVALPVGSDILAPADGIIRWYDSDPGGSGGIELAIDHTGPTGRIFTTVYLHLSKIIKTSGFVEQGEVVAKSGDTGNVTGAHLHFHIWSRVPPSLDAHTMPIERLVMKQAGIDNDFREYNAANGDLDDSKIVNKSFESPGWQEDPYEPPVPQDKTLVQAPSNAIDPNRIYWLQNNKLYWVPSESIISKMNGLSGWTGYFTGNVCRIPNNPPYQGFPDGVKQFITTDFASSGLLIVWKSSFGGDNWVYQIQDGKRRHIITEGAYYDYGIDKNDVIDVSGSIVNIFAEGEAICAVGQDASSPWLFKDCYRREPSQGGRYGYALFGEAYNAVHSWGNGFIQDFQKGADRLAIMQCNWFNAAYAVYGGMWNKYKELAEQESRSQTPPSYLGYPASDEREANPSVLGTKGRAQDFQYGHIHYHCTGKYAGRAFETHGKIDDVYVRQRGYGGSGSWLGFPISDQYKNQTGYDQSDFEGGYITTIDGYNYNAYYWPSNAVTVIPVSYTVITGDDPIENGNKNSPHSTVPAVLVSCPNGWENWQAGSQRNIVWSANDDVGVGSISLYYSTNGGASWTWITSGEPNNGVYSWQIPDISSTLCKIKVVAYDYSGMAGEDVSDNNFTIISKPRINIRPVVAIISGPTGITDNNAPIFTWAGSDSDGSVVGYHYSIDNSAPNRWTTNTYYACEALNNGNHAFYLSAQDDDGALSDVASQSFTVNVITVVADISPPILTISQPLFNGQIFTTQNITVAGTAFDESGIQRVVVNGETAFGTTTWTRDISLVKGFNFITVIVYDNSPNRNSKIGGLAVIYVTQTEISPEPSIVGMVYVATIGDDSAGKGSKARPYRTIQKGIDVAINGSIVLVADGIYRGNGNVNIDFGGKAITVKSENGPANCIVDCEGRDNTRGFYFHNNENSGSVLDGFTIRNGRALSDDWEYSSGGGIYCLSSSPTIKNNVITQNRAKSGGGILCDKSSAIIENNTIIKNIADDCGGGIACGNTPSPKIQSNIIKMNEAKSGGGINCNTSSPMITNNLIEGNSAIDGGAIRCWDRSYPKIVNSNILGNWASFGGGIRIGKESSVEIINTILWWNWNTQANNHEQISLNGFSGYDRNTVIISYSDVMNGQAGIITGNNNTNMINWGQGNIDLYPMFADAVNRDYHLSDNSPCLGAGIMASGVPSVDIEGNLRPNPSWSRPDMGMYESMLRSAMLGPDKMNKSDWLTNFKTESFQNYPNPFNPETWIPYQLSESGNVVVGIYDVSGRLVQKLDLGYKEAGRYVSRDKAAYWDGRNDVGELVPSGVYFYNIQAGAFTATKRMVIQK